MFGLSKKVNLSVIISFFFVFFSVAHTKPFKGMWVIRDELVSRTKIDSVIHYAKMTGVKNLFVQVRGRGTVYYHSYYENMDKSIEENFDPLAYVLEKASQAHIKVHAWFNTFLVWSNDSIPRSPKHPLNKFRDAILKDKYWNDYAGLDSKVKKGVEGFYLSPFRKKVQNYMMAMVKELITHYAVDGIHFDYIRYPNRNFINDPEIVSYLNNRYGLVLLNDSNGTGSEKLMTSIQKNKKAAEILVRPINQFLKEVQTWIKRNFPQVSVSAAVKPNPVLAKLNYYQDWLTWIEKGYLDFVVTMNYSKDLFTFKKNNSFFSRPTLKNKIVVGIGVFNKNKKTMEYQINMVNMDNFKGYAIFSYKHMKKKYKP